MEEETPRKKPGPKPGSKPPAETKEERDRRNLRIFQLFVAGHSEREIGRIVGLTGQRVHQIIKTELANASQHRELLTSEALAMYTTRLETLLTAVWPKVLKQDLKAVDVARRLMEQQARLYGLLEERPKPTQPDQELLDEENLDVAPIDDLTRYRLQHRPRPETGETG